MQDDRTAGKAIRDRYGRMKDGQGRRDRSWADPNILDMILMFLEAILLR